MARKGLLKKEVNRLLVEERKKMREKQKQSKFMQRTLNIYKSQCVRAKELGRQVYYTLDELRDYVRLKLPLGCDYCETKLTENSFVGDHKVPVAREGQFTLNNLAIVCKPCNFQKGMLTEIEFRELNRFLNSLPPDAARDVRARLTTGGKWMQH